MPAKRIFFAYFPRLLSALGSQSGPSALFTCDLLFSTGIPPCSLDWLPYIWVLHARRITADNVEVGTSNLARLGMPLHLGRARIEHRRREDGHHRAA